MEITGITAQDIADYFVLEEGIFNSSTPEGLMAQYQKGLEALENLGSDHGEIEFKLEDGTIETIKWEDLFDVDAEGNAKADMETISKVMKGASKEVREEFANLVEDVANGTDIKDIYAIDDMFSVDISEDSEGGIHMILIAHDGHGKSINLQFGSDSVIEFIEQHKNNPPVFELSSSRRFCPIGYHEDLFDKMVE